MPSITNRSEVPPDAHFAIIEFDQIWIEGDERSKTHPGHGYPGHHASQVHYYYFKNEEEWKKAIEERANPKYGNPKDNFFAARVTPATITKSVHVSVK
jgi:hypothetical protein